MTSDKVLISPYGFVDKSRTIQKLSELCAEKDGIQTGPFGSQLHSSDYVDDGTPIITVEHLGENIIEGKNPPLVHIDDVTRLIKYTLKEGDIVFSRVGSVDRRALVRGEQNGWMFSGRLLRVRPKPELVDPTYLSYFFGLPMFKTYIRSIAVGATMPSLNTSLLSDLPIILPEISEQKVIGRMLSSLDEKIRINGELSKTLENIAQTIFKSWYIDFDPVKANMAGEKPAGMDAVSADLFPDSFEESELGLIPKGWSIESIGNIAIIQGGKMLSREEFSDNGRFPIFGGAGVMGKSNKSNAEGFVITVGRVGAYCGQFFFHRGSAWVNNNASRIIPKENISGEWMYQFLKSFNIESIIKGAAQPFVSNSDLANSKIVLPSLEIIHRFTEIVRPIFEQREALAGENLLLGKLRDSLLPRLISGELKIPEEMLAS
jgi:type I restriction enzyme S subunit